MAKKIAVSTDVTPVSIEESSSVNNSNDLNMEIRDQMKAMKQELDSLRKALANKEKEVVVNEKIDGFDYIPVMSLYKYRINLTTEEKGRGTKYSWAKFGDVKNIMFNDLSKMLNVIPTFFSKGWLYIANPKTVHQLGMDETYKSILNKETMERAISGKADAIMIYNTANPSQKEVIRDFLISKVREDPQSVDMKLIVAFERDAGIKLLEMAEESKELMIPKK